MSADEKWRAVPKEGDSCDWAGCKATATVRSFRAKPQVGALPRPAWTANELFFCEEHAAMQRADNPRRSEEPAKWSR